MATFTYKKKDYPKRWRGQVTVMGRVVASKWFGSSKADEKLAIAWEVEKKKELAEAAKLDSVTNPQPIPLASEHPLKNRLTIQQWATSYLEESQRRNTLTTFKEKRDGLRRFIRYLEATSGLSPDDRVESFDRKLARKYLAWQHDSVGLTAPTKTVKS